MRSKPIFAAALVAALVTPGCNNDLTPTTARLRMEGVAGTQVTIVYSTTFIAAVTETGTTQVQLFGSNTIVRTLPVDFEVDIVENHQIFFQVVPEGTEVAALQVRVDIDGRVQFDESGDVNVADPWRFVYVFNRPTTRNIDVVL